MYIIDYNCIYNNNSHNNHNNHNNNNDNNNNSNNIYIYILYSQLLGRGPGYCISDPKTRVFLGVT